MIADLSYILVFWAYLFVLGIIFLPLSESVFSRFFDRGYLFGKTIAIVILAYAVWLLSALHILKFSLFSIALATIFAAVIIWAKQNPQRIKEIFIRKIWIYLFEEALFLVGLIFWAYIRGFQPDIVGLEKFMDFGFINAILRSAYMPPPDIWFAGEALNYYYFGHFIAAFLTRLSGVNPAIAYNLMIALMFAFCFSLSFSLAANAYFLLGKKNALRILLVGLISAAMVSFGGNLHAFIFGYAVPAAKSMGIYKQPLSPYWYPDSTRYIGHNPPTQDKTIHEFPQYSFVVADLHAHVSSIPYVLTFLAIILSLLSVAGALRKKENMLLLAIFLAIFYLTNSWDFPIYLTVMFFAYVYVYSKESGFGWDAANSAMLQSGMVAFTALCICLPFIFHFRNFSYGLGIVHSISPPHQLLVLWGYQLFFAVIFIIYALRGKKNLPISDVFVFILCVSAIGLVVIPEIIFVRDIYGGDYYRANTMFKLTYQAFIMFAVSCGYIAMRVAEQIRKNSYKIIFSLATALIIVLPLLYPKFAIEGYYGKIKPGGYKTLDGMRYMRERNPSDYAAVQWLAAQKPDGQMNVLEASGDSYTECGRISHATGFPTILGWYVHEWLWRGGPEKPNQRAGEVEEVYSGKDKNKKLEILRKYDIHYIIIGNQERQKYKGLDEAGLESLGRLAARFGSTKVIKIDY